MSSSNSNPKPKGEFAVIDLFAGPGGLAEGFASFRSSGHRPFSIVLSAEKDSVAHQTLLLRTFLHQFESGFPDEYYDFLNGDLEQKVNLPDKYPEQWNAAQDIARKIELGTDRASDCIKTKLQAIKEEYGAKTILLGGPPCQPYSLAGRSRNAGNDGYDVAEDTRHTLYQEYLRVLERLKPVAFVMENVKGMLSFAPTGEPIIRRILNDMEKLGYRLVALCPKVGRLLNEMGPLPEDFVVYTEWHGLPQARHRVIIVGLSKELVDDTEYEKLGGGLLSRSKSRSITVRDVLEGMPKVRSGISKSNDSPERWASEWSQAFSKVKELRPALFNHISELKASMSADSLPCAREDTKGAGIGGECPDELRNWLIDPKLERLTLHETRSHMLADRERYLFAAVYAHVNEISARAKNFPEELAPDHKNWNSGKFADRYRVQLWNKPSSTVTCHMSKDGHYYIHPDPMQCRSLTVREAARLQTFPDNYFFEGNRTEQYIQVGNAVPPFLARQIAKVLYDLL